MTSRAACYTVSGGVTKRVRGLEPPDIQLGRLTSQRGNTVESSVSEGEPVTPSSSPGSRDENRPLDDDLRRLIDAWPTLSDPVRSGIVAMVGAATNG